MYEPVYNRQQRMWRLLRYQSLGDSHPYAEDEHGELLQFITKREADTHRRKLERKSTMVTPTSDDIMRRKLRK